jgi:hypothetical protein
VQPGDWTKTVELYGLRESCFDLELPTRRILDACSQAGLQCFDPTQEMRDAHVALQASLYLPNHDMHWGAQGHKVLADILFQRVDRLGLRP